MSIVFGLEKSGRVYFPRFLIFQVLLYFKLAILNGCHDALQNKSEKLAHILGYQTGAVTGGTTSTGGGGGMGATAWRQWPFPAQ